MIVGGGYSTSAIDVVTVLDVEGNTTSTCHGVSYPMKIKLATGGLVSTAEGSRPLVCGGYDHTDKKVTDKCYLFTSGGWDQVPFTLTEGTYGMSSTPINSQWLFISGGWRSGYTKETFLLSSSGSKVPLTGLSVAKKRFCAAILQEKGDQKVVGVIGGSYKKDDTIVWLKSMERYSCSTTTATPTCNKMTDGPDLVDLARGNCGVLHTNEVRH